MGLRVRPTTGNVADGQLSLPAVQPQPPVRLDPLFRWPGGKRWLVPTLIDLVPKQIGTYYEPFLGGGALFFALRPAAAVLSDKNRELIECYQAIRIDHGSVAAHLRGFPRDMDGYYRIRASRPVGRAERAARLMYLATLGFSGIYRVNRRGEFNVPYGRREYRRLGSEGSLAEYAVALAHADIHALDFEDALTSAKSGDLIYLDPPYTVAHSNNGFLRYNESIFSWKDQERLARVAAALDRRGCVVILSNANHESIRLLYRTFRVVTISRPSLVAANPAHRRATEESLFTNVS